MAKLTNHRTEVTRSIRLDIPYSRRVLKQNANDLDRAADKPAQAEDVSLTLVVAAVSFKYKDGRSMSLSQLRIWKRIQDVLMDDDGKARTGPLTLSAEQFDWLVETMRNTQYPPQFAGAIVTYIDYLETLRGLGNHKLQEPETEEA